MGYNMASTIEKIKLANSRPNSKSQILQCGKCPVEDFCKRQTVATCPLVRIVESG